MILCGNMIRRRCCRSPDKLRRFFSFASRYFSPQGSLIFCHGSSNTRWWLIFRMLDFD